MRLTSEMQWKNRWRDSNLDPMNLNVTDPIFKEKHEVFKKYISSSQNKHVLEVGAYPGTYLNYFYSHFSYTPWGVEYVKECCDEMEKKLKQKEVPANVICEDFFSLSKDKSPVGLGWDLTVSFGFVEHFADSSAAISKHVEVTKSGGLVSISIPNHSGVNGGLLKLIDRRKWSQHNHMSLNDLENHFNNIDDCQILYSGYVGRLGFWNIGLYSSIKKKKPRLYLFIRAPFWIIEKVGQWIIPNNRFTSPDAIVIAKKTCPTDGHIEKQTF